MIQRDRIYEEVKHTISGNWGSLIIVSIIIAIISMILGNILDRVLPTTEVQSAGDFTETFFSFAAEQPYSSYVIKNFINGVFGNVLSGALSLSILQLVKSRSVNNNSRYRIDKYRIDWFFDNLSKYALPLLMVGLVMGIISSILSLIPLIGGIIEIIVLILLVFVVYSIPEDPSANVFELFSKSVKRTEGIRGDIVAIFIKYFIVPIVVIILSFIILVMGIASENSLILLASIGILVSLVLLFRASILNNIAIAILYDYVDGEEDNHYDQAYDQGNYTFTSSGSYSNNTFDNDFLAQDYPDEEDSYDSGYGMIEEEEELIEDGDDEWES